MKRHIKLFEAFTGGNVFLVHIDGEPYAVFDNEDEAYTHAQEVAEDVYREEAEELAQYSGKYGEDYDGYEDELEDLVMSGIRVNYDEISSREFIDMLRSMEEFDEIMSRSLVNRDLDNELDTMAKSKFSKG